jgi:predicted nuclease of predicted toxin-antitoxin system
MQYLIDEDLGIEVARVARGLGLDVASVQEIGRRGREWTDERHLQEAAVDGKCFVTANRDDFRRWTDVFAAEGRPHAGVLVVPPSLRRRGPVAVARALVVFEQTRGEFPVAYLFDFLRPAD